MIDEKPRIPAVARFLLTLTAVTALVASPPRAWAADDEAGEGPAFIAGSTSIDDHTIDFEYRLFDPPLPVGQSPDWRNDDSAAGAWLLLHHYESTGAFDEMPELAIDREQAEQYVEFLRTRPADDRDASLERLAARRYIGEIRIGDLYLALYNQPDDEDERVVAGGMTVKTDEGFRLVAVPYYYEHEARESLFMLLKAIRTGRLKLEDD